jgi:hypothetical protein
MEDVFEKPARSTSTLTAADESSIKSGFVAVDTADTPMPESSATNGPGERVPEQTADSQAVATELTPNNTPRHPTDGDIRQLRRRITETTQNFLHELSKISNDFPGLLPQGFHQADCYDAIDDILANLTRGRPPFDNGQRFGAFFVGRSGSRDHRGYHPRTGFHSGHESEELPPSPRHPLPFVNYGGFPAAAFGHWQPSPFRPFGGHPDMNVHTFRHHDSRHQDHVERGHGPRGHRSFN